MLNLGVAAQTKLGFARSQQLDHREARLLSVCFGDEHVRTGHVFPGFRGMRRVAIRTTDVVAPMLTTTKVVVFFLARVAGKTGFGDLLRGFVLKRNHLRWIAIFNVGLAGTVARLTTSNFSFPAAYL